MSSSWMACARRSSIAATAAGAASAPPAASAVSQARRISSSAQRRLTAVGRVASRPLRGLLERGPERGRVVGARGGGLGGRERDAPGRRDADGRRTADGHVADAVRDLTPGAAGDVALLLRQRELVDEHDLAGQDLDRCARAAANRRARCARRRPRAPRLLRARRSPSLRAQVPWSQEARYLACSSVSVSQSTFMLASLSRAISSSMSLGTT